MPIDATPLGHVTAQVMDDIEQAERDGDFDADAEIISALVVVEVRHHNAQGDALSTVTLRATDDRNVIGLGLAQRATSALLQTEG